MTEPECRKHRGVKARWRCRACEALLCGGCVSDGPQGTPPTCPECGGICQSLAELDGPRSGTAGFFRELPGILAYPVKGRGKFIILGAVITFAVADLIRLLPIIWIIGWVISVTLSLYICAYLFKIIGHCAAGDPAPPSWPDLSETWGDLVRPLLFILAAFVLSFGPALVYMVHCLEKSDPGESYYYSWDPNPAVLWPLLAVGALYLPMSLISLALHESLAGLSPHIVIPAIARTAPAYVVACGILAGAIFLWSWTVGFTDDLVPVLGPIIGSAASLYFLMLEMRILGLIFRTHEKKLGWFIVE